MGSSVDVDFFDDFFGFLDCEDHGVSSYVGSFDLDVAGVWIEDGNLLFWHDGNLLYYKLIDVFLQLYPKKGVF